MWEGISSRKFFQFNWLISTLLISPVYPFISKTSTKMVLDSPTMGSSSFKPGVAPEPLPDSIYYNKYIPLIFKMKVPEWSSETLKLSNVVHTCLSDSGRGSKDNILCPVAWHFDRLLAPLADDMRFSKNIYTPLDGIPYFGKINCDMIESHFFHLSANADELSKYIDQIKADCPMAKSIMPVTRNVTMSGHHVEAAYTAFMASAAESNSTKEVKMAAYIGLQSAQIMTKYIETTKWHSAFQTCQNGRLSIGLINTYMLRTALQPIQKLAEAKGYKLSIPFDEYLPQYYKLGITDCILGVQNTRKTVLMIRILVPIQKKASKYTRFRLHKIPYLVEEGGEKRICEIESFDSKDDFLVEETTETNEANETMIHETLSPSPECFESDLCYIPEQPRSLIVDPCLEGLVNGSMDATKEYCSFGCYPVAHEGLTLPIILQVGPNEYSITGGHDTHRLRVHCSNKLNKTSTNTTTKLNKTMTLEPNRTNGVMQVTLPCNCEIRFRTFVYKPTSPCTNEPLQVHYLAAIPYAVFQELLKSGKFNSSSTPSDDETLGHEIFNTTYYSYNHTHNHGDFDFENYHFDGAGTNGTKLKFLVGDDAFVPEVPDHVPADWILPAELVENKIAMDVSSPDDSPPLSSTPTPIPTPAAHSAPSNCCDSHSHAALWWMMWFNTLLLVITFFVFYTNRQISLSRMKDWVKRIGRKRLSIPGERLQEEDYCPPSNGNGNANGNNNFGNSFTMGQITIPPNWPENSNAPSNES